MVSRRHPGADTLAMLSHARQYKVRIGLQNHGDFLKTGRDLLGLIDAVGSEWCGPIVDTGYFNTPDPYADMAWSRPAR